VLLKREDTAARVQLQAARRLQQDGAPQPEQLKRGVICASAGNHAQGRGHERQKLGCRAVIVMPTTTPQLKVDAVKALGGEVVLYGDSYSDAYQHAVVLEKKQGLTFVHPFDDPDVIAGQGTIAMEILRQLQGLGSRRLDAVFVAIGGGGLISGVANYIKAVRPEIKVIGVQMNDSDAMMQSVGAKKRVTLPDVGLFSDGTAVKLVGEETFRISPRPGRRIHDRGHRRRLRRHQGCFVDTRSIVEPAGAMAVAAIKQYVATHKTKGETYAAILCGANMNFDRLRFVAERAEVGEEREALFAVTIPEERGSFRRFCEVVEQLPGGPRSVTEFNYRISHAPEGPCVRRPDHQNKGESTKIAEKLRPRLRDAGPHARRARQGTRAPHGRRAQRAGHEERLLRFIFPERPGALLKFLSLMRPNWNISLFHYRNQGADYGRILVGLQVPKADNKAFAKVSRHAGYPCVEETQNPVYQLFPAKLTPAMSAQGASTVTARTGQHLGVPALRRRPALRHGGG
jgi:threonine dehydratase